MKRNHRLMVLLRRLGRMVLIGVAVVVALLLVLTIVLWTTPAGTGLANRILASIPAVPGATLGVAELRGNWLTHLEAFHLTMERNDTTLAEVDTIRVEWRPWSLLRGRVDVRNVEVAGVHVSGDITRNAGERTPGESAVEPAGILSGDFYAGPAISVDRARLTDLNYGAMPGYETAGPTISDGSLHARDVHLGGEFRFVVEQFALHYTPIGSDSGWVDVSAAASLSRAGLAVDSLRVDGPSSRVYGGLKLDLDSKDELREMVAHLRARPLDLADLGIYNGEARLEGRVQADVTLRGPEPGRLSGTVELDCDGVQLGEQQLGVSKLSVAFADGHAEVNGNTQYQELRAVVTGWIRPLDTDPTYDLSLELDGLAGLLSSLSGKGAPRRPPGSMQARFRFAGTGFGPDQADVFGLVTSDTTRVELAGHLARNQALTWNVEQLRIDHLDVSQWGSGGMATDISGTVVARGSGEDLASLRAGCEWALEASRVGPTEIRSGNGRITIDGANVGASLRVDAGTGVVTIDTATAVLDLENTADVQKLLASLFVDGRAAVAHAAFRDRNIREADARVVLRDGNLNVTAVMATDAGAARLRVAGRPFAESPEFAVNEGWFQDIDVGAWAAGAPATRLSGTIAGEFDMGDTKRSRGAARSGSVQITFDSSLVATQQLSGGAIAAYVRGDSLSAQSRIDIGDEALALDARASLVQGRPDATLRATVPFGLLAAFVPRDSAAHEGALRIEANVSRPDTANVLVNARIGGHGRLADCTVDSLITVAHLDGSVLTVDTLVLYSNVGKVLASGTLVTPGTAEPASIFDASVDFSKPLLLRSLIDGGSGEDQLPLESVRSRLMLRGDSLNVHLETDFNPQHRASLDAAIAQDTSGVGVFLTNLTVQVIDDQWRLRRPTRLTVTPNGVMVDSLQMAAGDESVWLVGTLDRQGENNFHAGADNVGLDIMQRWFGREQFASKLDATLSVAGSGKEPDARASVHVETLRKGSPAGIAEARATWDGSVARVRAGFVSPEGDSLTASGHANFALPPADSNHAAASDPVAADSVGLRVDARDFPLAVLVPVLPPGVIANLSGSLDANLRLEGRGRSVTSRGGIEIANAAVDLPPLGVEFKEIEIAANLDGNRLVLERADVKSGAGRLSVRGDVALQAPRRVEPNLTVAATRFLAVDQANLRVMLSGDVDLSGEISAPVLRGDIHLNDCTYYLTPAVLAGLETKSDVQLTPADVQMLEETFGYRVRTKGMPAEAIMEHADIDLQVVLERNNWLRKRANPRLALELTGDVQMTKSPGAEMLLSGRIAPVRRRGYVEHFGRTFDIVDGEVLLNGTPDQHYVDVSAEYKIRPPMGSGDPEVVVTLEVRGQTDNLDLVLSSEPPLTENEIVTYITTGRSPVSTQSGEGATGEDAVALATDIGLSQVTGALEEVTQEKLGLDVVQVRYDPILGATLVAGRYLVPTVYVGLRQPLQNRESTATSTQRPYQTTAELEFELRRWLIVNVQGEVSLLRSFLRARREY